MSREVLSRRAYLRGCSLGWGWLASERVKAPSCEGAMLIGPVRRRAYSRPMRALPQSELAMVLSVTLRRPSVWIL